MAYNKDYYKKWNREYYLKHREATMARIKKWQKNNPEKFKAYRKKAAHKFQKTPKGIYRNIKQNVKRTGRTLLSREEFISWYDSQKQECFYCEAKPNGKRLTIDRKDNSKGYEKNNMALACWTCNRGKGTVFTEEEMKIIGQIIIKKRYA